MMLPKRAPVYDQKYRNSFKKMHAHTCLITGSIWTEYSSYSITACHITVGRHGWNIKDDSLILPLRQDLHMEMDRNQTRFWYKHFDEIPECVRITALEQIAKPGQKTNLMDIVKQIARNYYAGWQDSQ